MVTVTDYHQAVSGKVYVRMLRTKFRTRTESRPHLLRQPLSENRFLSIFSHITSHLSFSISYPSCIHPKYPGKKQEISRLFLPNPAYGKNPEVYNYIGQESALTIEKEIEVEMRAELYEFLLENKFKNGIMFKRSMELFVKHYNMEGTVEEDSLMRAFKRWRKAMKDNRKY